MIRELLQKRNLPPLTERETMLHVLQREDWHRLIEFVNKHR